MTVIHHQHDVSGYLLIRKQSQVQPALAGGHLLQALFPVRVPGKDLPVGSKQPVEMGLACQ